MTEALIADGAVNCRWGEGPYPDDEGTSREIVANSREGVSVDDLASLALGSPDFTPTSVAGVGDEALVVCFGANDGQPTFVYLAAVPRREWLENSGLWPAWRVENGNSTGVGPVCEPSSLTDVAAVTVRVGGGR